MPEQKRVYYNDNRSSDGNHFFGPPEIIVSCPEKMIDSNIEQHVAHILQIEGGGELDELLENVCATEHIRPVVNTTRIHDGEITVNCWEDYGNDYEDSFPPKLLFAVQLSVRSEKDGIHLQLSEEEINAVLERMDAEHYDDSMAAGGYEELPLHGEKAASDSSPAS